MMSLSIPRVGYFGRATVPVRQQGLEVQRAAQRSVVFALFLAISGGPAESAQAQADLSIPGGLDPLPCRDADGWTFSPSRQRLIRRMRHCPRRDLRVIRFPDPRPTGRGRRLPAFLVQGGL